LIEVGGEIRHLPNDFVWIFAGGTPPSEFLKASGIAFGSMSTDGHRELQEVR
jgi:thioredoxin reductase